MCDQTKRVRPYCSFILHHLVKRNIKREKISDRCLRELLENINLLNKDLQGLKLSKSFQEILQIESRNLQYTLNYVMKGSSNDGLQSGSGPRNFFISELH